MTSIISSNGYLRQTEDNIQEVSHPTSGWLPSPYYIPEIAGPEDLKALINGRQGLDSPNPIIVPGFRWKDIRSKPQFNEVQNVLRQIISRNPIFYYEPVELFRYTLPKNLVTYAFRGDVSKSKKFYKRLRKGQTKKAVNMLPLFFQPFLERQLESLLSQMDKGNSKHANKYSSGNIHEGWRDKRADKGYEDYFEKLAQDASKIPEGSIVIPPTPPILKSSGGDTVDRTIGVNRYMWGLCRTLSKSTSSGEVWVYPHIYIDQRAVDTGLASEVINKIEKMLTEETDFEYPVIRGIAITISNLEDAWSNNRETKVEKFVNKAVNTFSQDGYPVIMPRSGRYGLHLTDYQVNGFSSLMNGNLEYTRRSGGIDKKLKYGTVALYKDSVDVNIDKLKEILTRNGGKVHDIPGIPSSPRTFNPSANRIKDVFGKARNFRISFGKQRRLVHVYEAKELRDGKRNQIHNPAREYLRISKHKLLSS